MRYSTTIVLMVVAVGLAGYVYFVERGSRTTEQVEADRVKMAPGFDRDAVTRLSITRPGQPEVVIERDPKQEWRLLQPRAGRADASAVSEILSAVEFLEFRARVGDAGARGRAEYGLQPPKAVIRLQAGKELVLSVGNPDASGQGVYAARGDEPAVYVVEKRFRELLDRDPDTLRDRRLLVFDTAKAKEVKLGSAVLAKEGAAWFLTTPHKIRAATPKVEDLLRALETTRATRFVAGGSASGATVTVSDGTDHAVIIGGECPGFAHEVLAVRAAPDAAVFCLAKSDAQRVTPPAESLRDLHLLPVRPDNVRKVVIAAGGRELTLQREGVVWKVTAPAGATADDQVVRKWLEDLGSYRALATEPGDPASHGIGAAGSITVTVETEDGARTAVAIGASRDGRRWARRGDEGVLLQVHTEAGDSISADPLLFRSRKVLQFPRWEVRTITITAGGQTEVAERGAQEQWKLDKPFSLAADGAVVDKLLGTASDLRAEKFLAAAPGFTPVFTLRLATQPAETDAAGRDGGVRKPETYVLEVGGDAPGGGCVARSGGAFMVLARGACDDLRVHLATRRLVDLGDQTVVGVTLVRGGKSETLEKRGPAWHRATGPRVPAAQMDELLGTLRGLTARAVAQYGADTGHGLARPRLEAVLKLENGKELKLVFGAETDRGVYARLADRAVTYVVPLKDVEALEKAGQ
jgi:hypothetical protein